MNKTKHEKTLRLAILLTFVFFIAEVIGGFISGSLSLLGDAGHMLRDVFALIISLSAVKIARKLPSKRRTFGYHRVEIFAAFLNGLFLIAVGIWIIWEAFLRINSPQPIQSVPMLVVALIGLGVNIYIALNLHGSQDINIKSVFLHVMTDAVFSLAVIAAAILIYFTGKTIIDPILSAVISFVIIISAINIIKESILILLEFAPADIDFDEVVHDIQKVEGVQDVHHVHLWTLCSNINVIDAHIYTQVKLITEIEKIKKEIKTRLKKYNIKHATLEFECEKCIFPDEIKNIHH